MNSRNKSKMKELKKKADSEFFYPDNTAPDISQPETEPDISQQETEPEISQPEAEPDISQPEAEPDISQLETEPDINEPEIESEIETNVEPEPFILDAIDPELIKSLNLNPVNKAPDARGTIYPKVDFKPEWAAERLKKSLRGIGTDEKMIMKILVSHDSLQREEIEEKYKAMYGQDLIEDLKADLGGHFEEAVRSLMMSKYELLAGALNHSFTFFGSDANVLIEILCCRDNNFIDNLSTWYSKYYNQSLLEAMHFYLKDDFRALMISLVSGDRPTDDVTDPTQAQEDAEKLYDAGIGKWFGTDESEFINIMNNRSFAQLRNIFAEYEKLSGEQIENSIQTEFSGDIRDGLIAIVKRVKDPYGFFAMRLNESLRGAGTDDKTVIRIIVSRSEEDLENIKERYLDMYGSSLASDVKEDTGGDYAKILLAIINNVSSG